MLTRQKLVTYGIPTAAAATVAIAALLSPWSGGQTETPPRDPLVAPSAKHQVDVVFAVDTTGSMGGLIDGAKRTVWSIANHIRQTDPNADLRIGLVAYRDLGDDYVTRDFALTTDLDAVFVELSSYRAAGGGDTPENVDAALDSALKMQWRGGAKKLVFLVGDAPPASRGDVPTFDVLARQAAKRGVIINTIRAGHDSETATAFQRIASLGRGEFSSIQQDGGVQQVATPYDDKMAALSARIDSTAIIAGDDSVRYEYSAKMSAAEAAAPASKADRASYYSGKGGGRAAGDVVAEFEAGKDVGTIAPSALPADLRDMDQSALKAEVARRSVVRKAAQKELADLVEKRDGYLKDKAPGTGFDAEVKATLGKQLK